MPGKASRVWLGFLSAVVLLAAPPARAASPPAEGAAFFENQVRPLLVQACFKCHGPKKQEAGLRLDARATLIKGGDSGPAVVPGDPAKSLLIRAVGHEATPKMPPGKKLPEQQIAVLTRWVQMGAPWPADVQTGGIRSGPVTPEERRFWSFQPVANPPVPAVRDASWPASDVDRFILARLEARGLKPAPPADKRTLLRRATFDLTGLPPTPAEIAAFLADRSPGAFARVVDRLLASPHYGERWGRHWLDVVRYADTAGETADYPVPEAYRYRNYAIDAFNRDKPYDEFVREQVAGDLLAREAAPDQYAERVVATGFLALSRRFGYDTEKYEYLTIQDTIDTLGQSVLGLTLGCARCHDHKFDPVSTTDYYALYGFFASTRYAFPGSERLQQVRALVPLVPPAEALPRWEAFDRSLAATERELTDLQAAGPRVTLRPLTDLDGDFELQAAPSGGSRGLPSSPWLYDGGTSISTGAQSPYINLYRPGINGVSFPGDGANNSLGQGFQPAWTAATGPLYFSLDFRGSGPGKGTYRVFLGHGPGRSVAVEVFANADTLFVRNGRSVETVRALKPGVWYNLQLALDLRAKTYSGKVGVPGEMTAFAGKAFDPRWDGKVDYFGIDGLGHVGGVKAALDVDNVAVRAIPIPALAVTPPPAPAAKPVPASPEVEKRRAELRRQLTAMIESGPYAMAYAVADGTAQDVRVHQRGEPTKLGDVVPRRFLEILGGEPLPADVEGSGRLQLARWLTKPTNPLTARVLVNRLWQHHFGNGLVATPNDFGAHGRRPSHPELLDHLARRFLDGGWSVKAIHRRIMLSQTYQMSAMEDPRAAAADPACELLWHFPRRRLDAEALRDAMLALGGRLDQSPGGRHPFPLTEQCRFTQHNPYSAVYDSNRRSVYLMTQRIKRHPFLALFDGADTNASTPRRIDTTVPTQALFVMNDPFVHDQSEGLARQLIASGRPEGARVDLAYELALARTATAEESREALVFIGGYRQKLRALGLPVAEHELRAWAAFTRTLLAQNEFLFID
jgi:hypothetical protein